jgi:hypothetical protein
MRTAKLRAGSYFPKDMVNRCLRTERASDKPDIYLWGLDQKSCTARAEAGNRALGRKPDLKD